MVLPNGDVSLFDNGGLPMVHSQSRGLIENIDGGARTARVVAQFEHPGTALQSGSQGNLQLLPNRDIFIGWGATPYFSEFSSSGKLLFDAHLHGSYQAYRAYRFPWTGTPASSPKAVVSTAGGRQTVYVSWNGDTRTERWRLLAGSSARRLSPVATARARRLRDRHQPQQERELPRRAGTRRVGCRDRHLGDGPRLSSRVPPPPGRLGRLVGSGARTAGRRFADGGGMDEVTDKPLRRSKGRPARGQAVPTATTAQGYRRLPSGNHGLDPETVRLDQRQRLRAAMVELIAAKGYPAVRIADLSRLAHVSPPTLYSLYADKEQLFIATYDDIARRATETILGSYRQDDRPERRLLAAMRAFAELAVREPQAVSLLVLGAFGAGPTALRRRRRMLEALEGFMYANRDGDAAREPGDMTVRALLGGIREVTATRLRGGREQELPSLAEELERWALSYPGRLPAGLAAAPPGAAAPRTAHAGPSERARRAEGRLPSGRSDLPRRDILNSQRGRIVDATAAIVAEKGLAALTIPEIAKRASVSNGTFYAIYATKDDAFLGAQKVGMHQALRVAVGAYQGREEDDWPRAVAAGIRALLEYLASEPAHAHLTLVDTFAANPRAIATREAAMASFRAYLAPGFELAPEHAQVPQVTAEAVVGGIWQVLHHYIEKDAAAQLPELAPQLTYFALAPFLGAGRAADVALAGA